MQPHEIASEMWAMEPHRLNALMSSLWAIEGKLSAEEELGEAPQEKRPAYDLYGSTAVVPLVGVILKAVPWWFRLFGIEGTSTVDFTSAVNQAVDDSRVERLLVLVDSPGGTVGGVQDAAAALRAAGAVKPTVAHIDDLGASAAYWIASQAAQVAASETARVGSIGVYSAYWDTSEAFATAGIKVHLVRSGEFKGTGEEGVAIDEDELAPAQEIIDGLAQIFTADVAAGRGLSEAAVKALATGRVWLSAAARELGLVDAVAPAEVLYDGENAVWNEVTVRGAERPRENAEQDEKELIMSNDASSPAPAVDLEKERADAAQAASATERERVKALSSAFPNDPGFVLEQVAAGADLATAKAAYADVLKGRLDEAKAANAELEKQLTASAGAPGGAEPVEHAEAADTAGDFLTQARALAAEKGISKRQAMSDLARENPELHKRFVAASRRN